MLPKINSIRKSVTSINTFRGLNRSCNTGFSKLNANDSSIFTEFKDMRNMTSDKYPQLSPRSQRSRTYISDGLKIISNLLSVNDNIVFLDSNRNLHFNNDITPIEQVDTAVNHTLILYGNKIIIWPEKISVNISDKCVAKIDVINADKECIGAGVYYRSLNEEIRAAEYACRTSIQKCCYNFETLTKVNIMYHYAGASTHEIDLTNSDDFDSFESDFLKTIAVGDVIELKNSKFNSTNFYKCIETENRLDTLIFEKIIAPINYVCINADGIGRNIKSGDFVKLSAMKHKIAEGLPKPQIFNDDSYINVLNNRTFKVYDAGEDYIVVRAEINHSVPYAGNVTVTRVAPELDGGLIVEYGNRLWGCNSETNEIYCCKLGDETNWQAYSDGISTDSWYTVVGKEGRFTGAVKRNDSIIFFKENWALKICGTKPSNFALAEYSVQGVKQGSEKSLVNINGTLFYLGHKGVYAYQSGSLPALISENAFDNNRYSNAVGGSHGSKYYISAKNESNEFELFVFDTEKGIWHKEDNTQIIATTTYNSTMYYVDSEANCILCPDNKDNILQLMNNGTTCEFQPESDFEWCCETGDIYDSEFATKNISKIRIGIKPHRGSRVRLLAQYKDDEKFVEIANMKYAEKKPRVFMAALRRAEYLRLRFEGTGQVEIYGIDIEHSGGSDKRYDF